MKIITLVLVTTAILCFVDGKPHNEGKKAHQIKKAKEHELSNRMGHGEHHRREHTLVHRGSEIHEARKNHKLDAAAHKAEARKANFQKKIESMQKRGNGMHRMNTGDSTSASSTATTNTHDIKNEHLLHVTEHNIQKKQQDDKDGIPMESERLIHVTARPPKAHKVNKPHHKTTALTVSNKPNIRQRPNSSKAKAHKPIKKYSPKKHGWKKSMRKEKGNNKAKDKRERREKRNKALHHAIIARNL